MGTGSGLHWPGCCHEPAHHLGCTGHLAPLARAGHARDAALIAALITKLGRAFTPIAVKTVLTIS